MGGLIGIGLVFLIISIIVSHPGYVLIGIIIISIVCIYGNKANKRKEAVKAESKALNKVIQRDIRIVDDCVQIINTSVNVTTVIGRFNDLIKLLTKLSNYEKNTNVRFNRELPSAVLVRIRNEKPKILNEAIQRAYDDMISKCTTLKTESGRINRRKRFFDELNALSHTFPIETQKFLIELANKDRDKSIMVLESK